VATGPKLLFLDCDATLSGIEGVDELARLRGPEVLAQVAAMTAEAMNGTIPLEQVFARRLEIIRPELADMAVIGRLYIEQVEPTARETVAALKAAGWTPLILSAGYTQAIAPLAAYLGIERIEAVSLRFDQSGHYAGFDDRFPTTRAGGKPARILDLKRELRAGRTVMVGDGVSDLETRGTVDLFVGFGRYAERAVVKAGADAFICSFAGLPPLLE
jgi:phosphoserine phosphatase